MTSLAAPGQAMQGRMNPPAQKSVCSSLALEKIFHYYAQGHHEIGTRHENYLTLGTMAAEPFVVRIAM